MPENCQFLEINLQELEVFWPEISISWGIKKEENSLNSLILVTISWRRKNIFFIKKFWQVFFLQKIELNILGTKKLNIPRNVDFW